MIHLWILKLGLSAAYYIATIGYPLAETHKAVMQKTMNEQWKRLLSYWVIYLIMQLVSKILFFVSGYHCLTQLLDLWCTNLLKWPSDFG